MPESSSSISATVFGWSGRHTLILAVIVLATAGVLHQAGRVLWCACGHAVPWSWDIWSPHNSQHLLDPYFFSHVLHGLLFYAALHLVVRVLSPADRFCIAVVLESAWEILENSPVIIDRYRDNTIALGYTGDSIANSITDIAACAIGFLLAWRFPVRRAVALFAVTETVMALTIRDNLLLNILMLIWPLDAVKQWQTGL